MTQEIKAGDYVYIPSESLKPIKCFYDEDNECLRINFNDINAHVWFDENGCLIGKLDKTNIPLLWLATPENKRKIEQFYGISLEDTPVDRLALSNKVQEFRDMMNEYSCKTHLYYTQNHHELSDEIEELHQKLIQMYIDKE